MEIDGNTPSAFLLKYNTIPVVILIITIVTDIIAIDINILTLAGQSLNFQNKYRKAKLSS